MTRKPKLKPEHKPEDIQWNNAVNQAVDVLSVRICQMFLKAIKEHNRDKIIEIADAAWFFRGKFDEEPVKADPVRDAILGLRDMTKIAPMKIRTAVDFVEMIAGVKIPGKESGYKDFRDKCKELGLEIEPSREIRKK